MCRLPIVLIIILRYTKYFKQKKVWDEIDAAVSYSIFLAISFLFRDADKKKSSPCQVLIKGPAESGRI